MSNDPRSSISSYPSAASSSSRNTPSPYSTLATELGEGSASSPSKRRTSRRIPSDEGTSQRSSTYRGYLGDDLNRENELSRRKKPRRSGGFLLEPAFPGVEDEPPQEPKRVQETPQHVDVKGKSREELAARGGGPEIKGKSRGRVGKIRDALSGSLRSSPLAKEISQGDGQQNEEDESSKHSSSVKRSKRDTLYSQQGAHDGRVTPDSRDSSPEPNVRVSPMPAIDPTQIVHMALNLSESRRRILSGGQLASPMGSGRRVTSLALPPPNAALQGSYQGFQRGSSMRTAMDDYRRVSRNVSTSPTGRNTPRSRHVPSAFGESSLMFNSELPIDHQFSAATIARAEKFRSYMELRAQHIRLLNALPPLRWDSSAPGNFNTVTTSVPGTTNVQLTRTASFRNAKHDLGRKYNPLQFIRNRKSRARARQILNPDEKEWSDCERVKHWVDIVEHMSGRPDYREADHVRLPVYGDSESIDAPPAEGKKRPRMDWIVEPNELLADEYWLEQDDHKTLIEDRHGNKVFPKRQSAYLDPIRSSMESRRMSHERKKSTTVSLLEVPSARGSFESDHSALSDIGSERGRGRKQKLLERGGSTRRHKMLPWPRGRSHSSSSSDSGRSDADRKKSPKCRRQSHSENTGPLELHMKSILDEDKQLTISPDQKTPGTPDKWGIEQPHPLRNDTGEQGDRSDERRGTVTTVSTDTPSTPGRRHFNSIVREDGTPRISFDDDDSTRPNTPGSHKFAPPIGMDLSPPHSRRGSPTRQSSPTRKSRLSKLPFIRGKHKGSKDETDVIDFAQDSGGSRQTSGEVNYPVRTSLDKPSSHKPNGSVSSFSRPESRGKKDGSKEKDKDKEPQSAVTRFFKGGRIGEIVRNETSKVSDVIWKKEQPPEETKDLPESASKLDDLSSDSNSESDLESQPARHESPSTQDRKPRYHISNLPSFKHTSAPDDDHIYRQQLQQKGNRSSRFNRLAPPSLDISRVSTNSTLTPGTTDDRRGSYFNYSRSQSRDNRKLHEALEVPGAAFTMPLQTGLSKIPPEDRSRRLSAHLAPEDIEQTGLNRHRHWSITDADHRSHPLGLSITSADLARVRALLLCSGIKASEIARRAHSVREPPAFLCQAAETANAALIEVSRKEEHVLAARILSTDIENSTRALKTACGTFKTQRVQGLHQHLDSLTQLMEEKLMPAGHRLADEADREVSALNSDYTLRAREVGDRIEALLRKRRRRMRWVRRAGFLLLEWVLLGVMWWVWLVVVVVRTVLGTIGGVGRAVRWLFFL